MMLRLLKKSLEEGLSYLKRECGAHKQSAASGQCEDVLLNQSTLEELAERVGFVFALMPKDFGSSRFVTSPKSYQKWGKSSVRNVAEIGNNKGVPKDAPFWNLLNCKLALPHPRSQSPSAPDVRSSSRRRKHPKWMVPLYAVFF